MNDEENELKVLLEEESELSSEKLYDDLLRSNGRISLNFHLSNVGITNNPADIASDLADSIFLGRLINLIFPDVEWSYFQDGYKEFVCFELIVDPFDLNFNKLVDELNDFLNYESPDDRGDGYVDFIDQIFAGDVIIEDKFLDLYEDFKLNKENGSYDDEEE